MRLSFWSISTSETSIRLLQIFATDISEEALEKARSGIYLENIALDVSPERLRRFFVKHEGGYQVNKIVRDLCVFARQNLAKDPPFSKLDLISCRNVLIYLERAAPEAHHSDVSLRPEAAWLPDARRLGIHRRCLPISSTLRIKNRPHFHQTADTEYASVRVRGRRVCRRRASAGTICGSARTPPRRICKRRPTVWCSPQYGPPGVIINDDFEVVQFRGKTALTSNWRPGKASLNLLKMLREGLLLEVRNAVQKVKRTGERVSGRRRVPTKQRQGFRDVDLDVMPLQPTRTGRHYPGALSARATVGREPSRQERRGKSGREPRQVEQVQQELIATRQYLQSIIEEQGATNEELQSANEEILSSNEELQSINEELETAKEELQSTNEELTTVNEELQNRNPELSQINDDLNNLLSSVNMAIVMLSSDLRIRRFTPTAGRILNIIPTDIGRPITDLRPAIHVPELGELIAEVLDSVTPRARSFGHGRPPLFPVDPSLSHFGQSHRRAPC